MISCYFGTYASDGGEGIYRSYLNSDTGTLSEPELFCKSKDSKYLVCDKNFIYTVFNSENGSGVLVCDLYGQVIDSILFEKMTSCYIIKDKEYLFTANYHEGTITKLIFQNNKLTLIDQIHIQTKAGCHQVIIHQNQLIIPCLLIDQIIILDYDLNILQKIPMSLNSGVRHGVIVREYLYLVDELDNLLHTFFLKKSMIELCHSLSFIPNDKPSIGTAAIRSSLDQQVLFVSTRESNLITTFDISQTIPVQIQQIPSLGDHPRDCYVFKNHLIVANRLSGNVVVFALNNNQIINKSSEIKIPGAVAINILED